MSGVKSAVTQAAAPQQQTTRSAPAASLTTGVAQRLGNQYLQMLLRARQLQAKLTVNRPDDAYEQEADRVADRVMRMPLGVGPVSAISALPPADPETALRRSGESASDVPAIDAATESSIRSLSGRGSPLPDSVRSFMEPRFNADFGVVRVHNDADAHSLARSVSAQAFTVGRNVVFGAGHYAPDTEGGKRLLAHELTHVVQQGGTAEAPGQVVHRKPRSTTSPAAKHARDDQYTPAYLDPASATEWASRAEAFAAELTGDRRSKTEFTFIIVTNGVYVFSDAGVNVASFKLVRPPPVLGLYLIGANEAGTGLETRQVMLDKRGRSSLREIGGWRSNQHVKLAEWSTMNDQEQAKYLTRGFVMVVVPGHPRPQSAPKKTGTSVGNSPLDPNAGASADATPGAAPEKKAEEFHSPPSGSEYEEKEGDKVANDAAFPASLEASSNLVIERGSNEMVMHLDLTFGQGSPADAVWEAGTVVDYRWERWDVTNVPEFSGEKRDEAAKELSQAPRSDARRVRDQYLEHAAMQRIDELAEDVQNSKRVLESGGTPGDSAVERLHDVLVERDNLALAPVSALKAAGGQLFDSVVHPLTTPANEVTLRWAVPGLYLVRCIATPRQRGKQRRLSSKATALVEVRPAAYVARNTLAKLDDQILQLRIALELATDPDQIKRLDEEIKDLQIRAHGSVVEALAVAIKNKQAELDSASGEGREALEKELKSLAKQLALAQKNEANAAPNLDGSRPGHALRPEAAIASEVTGATFPLLLQLVPLSHGARPRWAIYDLTGTGSRENIGEGDSDEAAIARAFKRFAAGNEYGRGTVMLRIPDAVSNVSKRELIERNVQIGDELAKKRLHDLASVLMVVGLIFPPAMAVGAVIGGALAAEHILERWRTGSLEWDASLAGDVIAVVAAVATVGQGVAGLVVRETQEAFVIASASGDIGAIDAALAKMAPMLAAGRMFEVMNEIAMHGGLILGTAQVLDGFRDIDRAEKSGAMTHAEARAARARLVLNAIQTSAMLFSGARRKGARNEEARPAEPTAHQVEPETSSSGVQERTIIMKGGGGPTEREPTSPLPPLPREGSKAPERLYELLERGPGRSLQSVPLTGPARVPSGTFRRNMKSPIEAYRAYQQALGVSVGREVAIWYHAKRGEYAVEIGNETSVAAPTAKRRGDYWIALVHFHPNRSGALTFRLPAPKTDFASLWNRLRRSNETIVREFVEWDIPGGGRGRTEFGIDLAHPSTPLYVRLSHPDGRVDEPLRFKSDVDYLNYYNSRKRFIEPGSPEYELAMSPAREAAGGAKTIMGGGTSGGGGEKPPASPSEPVPKAVATSGTGRSDDEVPELTPEQRGDDIEREEIGQYVIRGKKTLPEEDGVFNRTIEDIDRVGGPTNDVRPLLDFMDRLCAEAEAAHATTLRIRGTMIENANVRRIDRLAKLYNGSVKNIDNENNVIEIPLPAPRRGKAVDTAVPEPADDRDTERTASPLDVEADTIDEEPKALAPQGAPRRRRPRRGRGGAGVPSVPLTDKKVGGFGRASEPRPEPKLSEPKKPPRVGEVRTGGFARPAETIPPSRPRPRVKVEGFKGTAKPSEKAEDPRSEEIPDDGDFVITVERDPKTGEKTLSPPKKPPLIGGLKTGGFGREAERKSPVPRPPVKVGGFGRAPERPEPDTADEHAADEEAGYEQVTDEQIVDEQPADDRAPNERAMDESADRDGVVLQPLDEHSQTTRRLVNPQGAASTARIEQIGDFRYLVSKEWDGPVRIFRIAALVRGGGPKTGVGPFMSFFRRLMSEAKSEQATKLIITGEFGGNENVGKLGQFVAKYKGRLHKPSGDITEFHIPLAGPPLN